MVYTGQTLLRYQPSSIIGTKKQFWNNICNGLYPSSFRSLGVITTVTTAFYCWESSATRKYLLPSVTCLMTSFLMSIIIWLGMVLLFRYALKQLFMYKGWIYRPHGKAASPVTLVCMFLIKLLRGKEPKLYSYQASLPKLPVPNLEHSVQGYLQSMKPLVDEEKYACLVQLATEFQNGKGKKLQRYLKLKSWWTSNYVTDWWEEYAYLRGRSPLMVNSNVYGIDAIFVDDIPCQAARAANLVHASFLFRRDTAENQTMKPIMIQNLIPLCSWQYARLIGATRIPGIETDRIVHFKDTQHIIVYHKGCYYKLTVFSQDRLLKPCEIQLQLMKILNEENVPEAGEKHLAALTASDRVTWARARMEFFSRGLNKQSLDTIEEAAFVLSLDEESYCYDKNDPEKLNNYAQSLLHGKGYDRWFDKSFTMIIGKNGRLGFNAEHSLADAPIMSHFAEWIIARETIELGHTKDGNTNGTPECQPPVPVRLKWEFTPQCLAVIEKCRVSAQALLEDVDLTLTMYDAYGKRLMKKCRVSPDAYVQMALQLAYFRDAGKFNLTYESSMTRLYAEGRTDTVRSVTLESCAFVRAMQDQDLTKEKKLEALRKACSVHQRAYQDAMCGKGVDRHLFALYIVSKYLDIDSPFLKEVLSEPWRLSTSQTPHRQTEMLDLKDYPKHLSAGGGFGPACADGYGVSYLFSGEDVLFFHISSMKSSPATDSRHFMNYIANALEDMKNLLVTCE